MVQIVALFRARENCPDVFEDRIRLQVLNEGVHRGNHLKVSYWNPYADLTLQNYIEMVPDIAKSAQISSRLCKFEL
jgi:hypothetical protein